MEELDAVDAGITIEAALKLEESGDWKDIEQLWRVKAGMVRERQVAAAGG